jgi:hypothetical protein
MAAKHRRSNAPSRRESSSGADATIKSKILGRLRLQCIHVDVLGEDWYHYESTIATRRYGKLTIVLNTGEERPDWNHTALRAEMVLPSLLKKETRLRQAAIPAVRRLLKRYGYPWSGTDARLIANMKLHQINFTDASVITLLYSGGKPFHGLDIDLTLGARLGLHKVGFDG